MTHDVIPVILVHGWNSHPGAWKLLIARLEEREIPFARFDHSGMSMASLGSIAGALERFCASWRVETGHNGPVDMVCHSVGTCIARYYLEVCDGNTRRERVRQLIGIGPPNNGSALAELFVHPVHGPGIIDTLTGVFVPRGYDPAADAIVNDVRPKSPFMERLRAAGTRPDITYRIIVTANPDGSSAFFPLFSGMTWEMDGKGGFRQTLAGDGIVAHAESHLAGASLDIIPAPHEDEGDLPPPALFCHINLTKNPMVAGRVIHYLTGQ
jgi:pimeloyl-ACP methyl ester carboxylesterase